MLTVRVQDDEADIDATVLVDAEFSAPAQEIAEKALVVAGLLKPEWTDYGGDGQIITSDQRNGRVRIIVLDMADRQTMPCKLTVWK